RARRKSHTKSRLIPPTTATRVLDQTAASFSSSALREPAEPLQHLPRFIRFCWNIRIAILTTPRSVKLRRHKLPRVKVKKVQDHHGVDRKLTVRHAKSRWTGTDSNAVRDKSRA